MPTEAEVDALLSIFPDLSFVRCFVAYAATITDAPKIFMLHGGLQAVLAAFPPDVRLRLGVPIGSNSFTWLVGESGSSRKTTAIMYAMQMVQDARLGSYLLLDPASPEALVRELGTNPHRMVPYTEGGDFLRRTQRGEYQAKLRDNYVRLYDGLPVGHTVKSAKKSLKPVYLHNVSVFVGSTPSHLENYLERVDFEGGLFNRFMLVHGEREREYEEGRDDPAGWDWLASHLAGLMSRQLDHPPKGPVGFAPDALDAWRTWGEGLKAWRRELSPGERELVNRSTTHAVKLLLVLSFDFGDMTAGAWRVQANAVQAATQIASWAALSALGIHENLAGSKYEREARTVLRALSAWESRGVLEAQYSQLAHTMDPRMRRREMLEILGSLVAERRLHEVDRGGITHYTRQPQL